MALTPRPRPALTQTVQRLVDERVGAGVLGAGHRSDLPAVEPRECRESPRACSGCIAGCLTL